MEENKYTFENPEYKKTYWHTCSHIMAQAIKPLCAPDVEKFLQPAKKQPLSQAVMETLSIIAYKQPITRMDVEAIRGVRCDYAINTLIDYHLVCELGRLDAPGRPILFGTTDDFLRSFGISSLEELPVISTEKVEQFKEEAEEEAVIGV